MALTPGSKILVALDTSDAAEWAFHLATRQMDKKNDFLVLMTVVQLIDMAGFGHSALLQSSQEQAEQQAKALIRRFGRKAKEVGVVHVKLNLTYGSDIGEAIVAYIEKYPVDILYIGRRPITGLQRFILGSISKHLMENAQCNVTVVKQPFGPEEIHSSKQHAVDLEEEERARRIKEHEVTDNLREHWIAKKHVLEELQLDHDD